MPGEAGVTGRRESRRSRRVVAAGVLILAPSLAPFLAAVASAASVTRAAAGTVLVTNLNTNTVSSINTATHKVSVIQGAGGGFNGPLGIAVAPNGATAYVTNSLGSTVTPINLTTSPLSLEQPIHVGGAPAAIAITSNGKTAYVTNFNSNTVTPLDLTTSPATPGTPIRVGLGPWSVAVSPDGRTVCVSNSESNTVSVINAVTRTVTSIGLGGRPQAIAISPRGTTAYVANGNDVTAINLATSPAALGASIYVGNGPVGLAVSPDGATAYTANTDDTVTPINLTTRPATAESPVRVGTLSQPDGVAISPDGKTAYAANASNDVTPISLTTSPITPESPIQVGAASFGIAVVPDQYPVARLRVTPDIAGKKTLFDASGSRSVNGTVARFTWHFGDATSKTTVSPTTTHVYAHAGIYRASVVVTTRYGTSTATTYTGQTVSNNGNAAAEATKTFSIGSSLQLTPPSGSPGEGVTLRDTTFTSSCRPVYVFFDHRLVGQTAPIGRLIYDKALVVPGDAVVGWHHIELSCSTKSPHQWLLSARFHVVTTKNHLSEFSVAQPTLGDLRHNLAGAGGVSILMLILGRIISAGFPSEWLDRTYEANRDRFGKRLRRRFPRMLVHRDQTMPQWRKFLGGMGIFGSFVVTAGLINSFLDPSFGFNRTTLWLWIGQCLGVGAISLCSQLPMVVAGLRQKRRIHLQVLLGGIFIAVVCVAISRAIGLSPGYCYGLIAVFLLRPEVSEDERGRLHALASLSVLVMSTAAFLLTIPVFKLATSAHPSPFWLIVVPALNVMFLAGFASLAFGMFPLPFLPGRHIAEWNRLAWLAIGGAGLIGFTAVVLSPGGGSQNELRHIGAVPLVAAFVGFALVSLGVMVYFRLHPREEAGESEAQEPKVEPATEGT